MSQVSTQGQTNNESPFYTGIPFSFKTLSDEVFLQYLHDSPPIDILFVFIQYFGLSYLFDVGIFILRNLLV